MTQFNQNRAEDLRERQLAREILRNSPTMRMAASLGGPWWHSGQSQNDEEEDVQDNGASLAARNYFASRSEEETRAARMALNEEARDAHQKLATLYADLAREVVPAPVARIN